MEKKIEVEVNGRKIRIMPHMLSDLMKFGATETMRTVKSKPKELLEFPIPKKIITPDLSLKKEVLPEMKITPQVIKTEPEKVETEKKARKTPVKSKAKK